MKFDNITPSQIVRPKQSGSHKSNMERYAARPDAVEFPMMIVIAVIYPCNFGCPECPYHNENSNLRKFYRSKGGDYLPEKLWKKMADEAGPYQSFMRCTGGGEPFMHPKMVDMVEYAKEKGARLWINTNGSMLGPSKKGRERLYRTIKAGADIMEFSMDAGSPEHYAELRPPIKGPPKDQNVWFENHVDNIREAIRLRKELNSPTRIVVSMIRQKLIEGRLEEYIDFYKNDVGVDEVITRKFLSWDSNTNIDLSKSLDNHLYKDLPSENKEACVWPFERLNVDTLGRIALCGQDISFSTAPLFPNLNDHSIKDIWQGEMFNWYRKKHLDGKGNECAPCRGCSAWLAGVRDKDWGWLQVLKKSGDKLKEAMANDTGADVEIYEPPT